jgi:hypothetical protein
MSDAKKILAVTADGGNLYSGLRGIVRRLAHNVNLLAQH